MARSANGPDGAPSDTTASERDPKADGPDRRERLLNLLAALIETRAGLTREDIDREPDPGLPAEPGLGSPRLRARQGHAARDGRSDPRRRRRRRDPATASTPKEYYLPDLDLTADELAALHVAVTAIGARAATRERVRS